METLRGPEGGGWSCWGLGHGRASFLCLASLQRERETGREEEVEEGAAVLKSRWPCPSSTSHRQLPKAEAKPPMMITPHHHLPAADNKHSLSEMALPSREGEGGGCWLRSEGVQRTQSLQGKASDIGCEDMRGKGQVAITFLQSARVGQGPGASILGSSPPS